MKNRALIILVMLLAAVALLLTARIVFKPALEKPVVVSIVLPVIGVMEEKLELAGDISSPVTGLDAGLVVDVPQGPHLLIRNGMAVTVKISALSSSVFYGIVKKVGSTVDPVTRTVKTDISVPNKNGKIRPGMSCVVDLVVKRKPAALILPRKAVRGEGSKYVFVVVGGLAQKRQVTTGIENAANVEITSGVRTTNRVIVSSQDIITSGTKVF